MKLLKEVYRNRVGRRKKGKKKKKLQEIEFPMNCEQIDQLVFNSRISHSLSRNYLN